MTEPTRTANASIGGRGLRFGRYAGVDIMAHWSLLVIFGLIMVSLGVSVFPLWHPDWSPVLRWSMAFITAALFFVSIAVHELAHAIVGRWQGVPVESITLFIFGGMAHTTSEPRSAKAELLMAAVGPLVSLIIGVLSTLIGSWLAVRALPDPTADPFVLLAGADPFATVFLWLGPINILLAFFNLIPGFPLDGGRILRAILWWTTGSLKRATAYAAGAGRVFAWLLIACGILMMFGFYVPLLGVGLGPGLWLVLIGWFLHNAAQLSYQQMLIGEALEDVPARAIMRTRLQTVPPWVPVASLNRDYFMSFDQRSFPVMDESGRFLGIVCLEDVRAVPRAHWEVTTAADVMTPAEKLETLQPEEPAIDALRRLSRRDVDQLPVMEGGRLLGLVQRRDIMKWLAVHAG